MALTKWNDAHALQWYHRYANSVLWELSINWLTVDSTVNLRLMLWLDSQSEDADAWLLHWVSEHVCVTLDLIPCFFSTVRWNLNDVQKHQKLNLMENLTTGLVFMIVVVNVFITAFGVHRPNRSNWPKNTFRYSLFWLLLFFLKSSNIPSLSLRVSFQIDRFFFSPTGSFVSTLRRWTRVWSACFREPALLTSTTSYLTYKHTDLSGLAEKFPPHRKTIRGQKIPLWASEKETAAVTIRDGVGEWGGGDGGGWYVNSTTFVCVGGRTGKRRQQRPGSRDFAQSVGFVGWEWPQVPGQTHCCATTALRSESLTGCRTAFNF